MNITDLIKLLSDKLGTGRNDIEVEIDGDDLLITVLDGAELVNDDRDEMDQSGDDEDSDDT